METSSEPKKQFLSAPAAILVAGILIAGAVLLNGRLNGGGSPAAIADNPSGGGTEQPTTVEDWEKYATADDPAIGSADAPVTMIEFSDFQCPFCARFWSETYGLIKRDYIDTGKVRLIYRDFPLSFHPFAKPAAIAASCAHEQGKFWEYHDTVFKNQDTLSDATITAWGKEVGLDTAKFSACIASGKYDAEINTDIADGSAAGVNGTPAFIINGAFVVGAQPYEAFKAAIDAALAD